MCLTSFIVCTTSMSFYYESYRSARNFVIDLTRMPANVSATGIHWQVSQSTSLVNVVVNMSTEPGNNHQGMSFLWMMVCSLIHAPRHIYGSWKVNKYCYIERHIWTLAKWRLYGRSRIQRWKVWYLGRKPTVSVCVHVALQVLMRLLTGLPCVISLSTMQTQVRFMMYVSILDPYHFPKAVFGSWNWGNIWSFVVSAQLMRYRMDIPTRHN